MKHEVGDTVIFIGSNSHKMTFMKQYVVKELIHSGFAITDDNGNRDCWYERFFISIKELLEE